MPPAPFLPTIRELSALSAPLLLGLWGLVLLLADLALLRRRSPDQRRRIMGALALAGALGSLLLTLNTFRTQIGIIDDDFSRLIFFGTLTADASTRVLNVLICALLAMVVSVSTSWSFTERWGEYYALVFWAAVGMIVLIASAELVTLFLALETMTLCLYLLTAFETDARSTRSPEAGLKYFVYGSVASALFLFGLSWLYGLTGTTRLDAIRLLLATGEEGPAGLAGDITGALTVLLLLVGFGFKVAAVPFHQWAPDAYEGAPAPVSAWIAAGSKVASVVVLMKVFGLALDPWARTGVGPLNPGWVGLLAVISAVTMTYGNLAALVQQNFKRMLAYSSIAHAGYILVGVLAVSTCASNQEAGGAVLFYLVIYAITTVSAFAVAAWLAHDRVGDDIDDLDGLGTRAPLMALAIVVLMLSLIGIPPFAGFFGKLYMFMEAIDTKEPAALSLTWLVGLALLNSVISAFYYVRVLKAMYLRPARHALSGDPPRSLSIPILTGAGVAILFGVLPTPLLETLKSAAIPMLSPAATSITPIGGTPPAVRLDPIQEPAAPRELPPPSHRGELAQSGPALLNK